MSTDDEKIANLYEKMVENQQSDTAQNSPNINATKKLEDSDIPNSSNRQKVTEKGFDQIQPITTQEKFNIKLQKRSNSPLSSASASAQYNHTIDSPQKNDNAFDDFLKQSPKPSSRYKEQIEEQSKRFREYLNEKVEELKKSKNETRTSDKKANNMFSPVRNSSNNKPPKGIRDIVKQQQSDSLSKKSILEKKQFVKPNSTVMSHQQKNAKNITGNSFSEEAQRQKAKRFSNSHSNLDKSPAVASASDKKRTIESVKNQLPMLTPPIKSNAPKQGPLVNMQNPRQTSSTIDRVLNPKQTSVSRQSENRETAQSKNSFRIKKTQNSNKNIPSDSNKPNSQQPKSNNSINLQTNVKFSSKNHTSKQIDSEKSVKPQNESPAMMSKNKRLRQEFIRLNDEEKVLQRQIFNFHNETKDYLENFQRKYALNFDSYEKYGCKPTLVSKQQSKKPSQNIANSRVSRQQKQQKSEEGEQNQANLKEEEQETETLNKQIEKLENLLKQKQRSLRKSEHKLAKNAYLQYLRNTPHDILEMQEDEEEEQEDQVTNLGVGAEAYSRQVGNTTYSESMNEIKSKKWGLKQRITFQTHRDNSRSKVNFNPSPTKESVSQDPNAGFKAQLDHQNEGDNRIAVNSRLKNLLLD